MLELMEMAIPVIVSDLAPLKEMVTHNETGLVCQANNIKDLCRVIASAFNNINHIHLLGKQARSWVIKNRTWEMNAQRYKTLYSSLG